jgi:hypothetical protein
LSLRRSVVPRTLDVLRPAEEVVEDDIHSGVYIYDHGILLAIYTPEGAAALAL